MVMLADIVELVIGVDTHKATHTAADGVDVGHVHPPVRGLAGVTDLGQPGERGDAPGAPPGPIWCLRPGTRSTLPTNLYDPLRFL
jgi:hypothetical protein